MTFGRDVDGLFRQAMAGLCSGVAVLTAVRTDNRPCGLLATSVSSFSVNPPSIVASIAHTSRCHDALTCGPEFGVNVLAADQEHLAGIFSSARQDKFAQVDWECDNGIPRLPGALSFLRCSLGATFERYDHTLIIGDVVGGDLGAGDPLVYMARSMGWRLSPARLRAA